MVRWWGPVRMAGAAWAIWLVDWSGGVDWLGRLARASALSSRPGHALPTANRPGNPARGNRLGRRPWRATA
ncbi:hypothetical protein GCM10027360_20220 [Amycolatopsis echigonensis]